MIPSVNGSSGVYVGARVKSGGCHLQQTTGVFFFVFASNGEAHFTVSTDIGILKHSHLPVINFPLMIGGLIAMGLGGSLGVMSISTLQVISNIEPMTLKNNLCAKV